MLLLEQDPRMLPETVQAFDKLCHAEFFFPIALLIGGALILLFGWKAHKWIVVLNCIALGFWVGGLLGERAQVTTVAAIIGGCTLGAISWPLMKYAVAVCGGLVGAIVGMVAWAYFEPSHVNLAWAGGLAGFILCGMLSFVLFKTSIILFTCVQGAAMLVLGASALLVKYTPWEQDVASSIKGKPILMPLLVISIAVLGIVWQQQRHGLIGNDGAPSGKGGGGAKPAGDAKK